MKHTIRDKQVRVVAVNVPTTWQHLFPVKNEFDSRMFVAINDMLMDMLAAVARRDYQQRRERQQQGIAKAKTAGKYPGRQIDLTRYEAINRLLSSGNSWSVIQKTIGCSRSTISSAIKHAHSDTSMPITLQSAQTFVTAILWLHIKNGSKFTRGKKRAQQDIDDLVAESFESTKLNETEYRLVICYADEVDLKQQLSELLEDIHDTSDLRNCVIDDVSIINEATGDYWDEYDGKWDVQPPVSATIMPLVNTE